MQAVRVEHVLPANAAHRQETALRLAVLLQGLHSLNICAAKVMYHENLQQQLTIPLVSRPIAATMFIFWVVSQSSQCLAEQPSAA